MPRPGGCHHRLISGVPPAQKYADGLNQAFMLTASIRLYCLVIILVPLTVLWLRAGSPPSPQEAAGLQPSSNSCRACHQAIFDSFVRTAHFQTSSHADARSVKGNFADGHNALRTQLESVHFKMERRGDGFYQTGYETMGVTSRERTERLELVIGSGRKGQSYLYWKAGLLYQLPVSWLVEPAAWMNSPGYEDGKVNFDRLIPPRCLECHSSSFRLESIGRLERSIGSSERTATGVRYASDYEVGISCRNCHGDSSRHAEYHSANPADKVARLILNPSRLERERKLDGCALCHSGPREAKKPPFSYRPGERLDDYFQPTLPLSNLVADVHGNQIALLSRSKCFRSSPEMSCSTCHNVHRAERDLAQMAVKCLQCHQTGQCKLSAKLDQARLLGDCVECHMPNQPSQLIRINTPAGNYSPAYRQHTIGVYREIAERLLRSEGQRKN